MYFMERLKAALLAIRCRDARSLSPRVSFALLRSLLSTRPVSAETGTIVYTNCPPLGGEPFQRYLQGLGRMAKGEHIPLVAHISVTDRCDYHCARCSNIPSKRDDPSLGELTRLLCELKDAGTASVAFTGGEPTLRPDLPRIIEACGKELSPILFTSGQRLDGTMARDLRQAGLTAAFISLDHYKASEHNRVRGDSGAFEQAVMAINACLQAGIYTTAQAVVDEHLLRENEMDTFLDFCRQLGVHDVVILEPIPVGLHCPCKPIGDAAKERLRKLHARAAREPELPKVTAMSFLEGPAFFGCQAGYAFVYVNTAGDLFPCDFAPISFGNVYDSGLKNILPRLKQSIKSPSRKCLALSLRELMEDGVLPIQWEQTRAAMARYSPGELPDLMKWIMPKEVSE